MGKVSEPARCRSTKREWLFLSPAAYPHDAAFHDDNNARIRCIEPLAFTLLKEALQRAGPRSNSSSVHCFSGDGDWHLPKRKNGPARVRKTVHVLRQHTS